MALKKRPYARPEIRSELPNQVRAPLLMCTAPLVQCPRDPIGTCTGDQSGECGCPSSDIDICG